MIVLCQRLYSSVALYLASIQLSAYYFGLMYKVFIIPLFDYCDVVWTSCLAKQVKAIEHIYFKVTFTVWHLRANLSYLHVFIID